ncbi:MAG: hypothetical protein ACAI25_20345, partial [Planctomycetota bacterium]
RRSPAWDALQKARRARPRSIAPRVYLAVLGASRGTTEDAACALEDLLACQKIARVREQREPGVLRIGLALARARLAGRIELGEPEPDLEWVKLDAVLDRWQIPRQQGPRK